MNENELHVIDEREFWFLKRKSNIKQKWVYGKHIFNRTAEKSLKRLDFQNREKLEIKV